ncbi:MAG: DEAD/DEAH box helicase [Oligoflexales bacterium]
MTKQQYFLFPQDMKESYEDAALISIFQQNRARGLLRLYADSHTLSHDSHPSLLYWCGFIHKYLQELCLVADEVFRGLDPQPGDLETFLKKKPDSMSGVEFVDITFLQLLWQEISTYIAEQLQQKNLTVRQWLQCFFPEWEEAGKLHFHFAEDSQNLSHPFAFLATYSTRVMGRPRLQHVPLGKLLEQVDDHMAQLHAVMKPLQKAAESSVWLKSFLASQKLNAAIFLKTDQAWEFLRNIDVFEACGIVVRCPEHWKEKTPKKAQVQVSFGGVDENHKLGTSALLQFKVNIAVDGQTLSEQDLDDLLAYEENLVRFKGQWIQLDRKKVGSLLEKWKKAAGLRREGVSFADAMKMLSGVRPDFTEECEEEGLEKSEWLRFDASRSLKNLLHELRDPSSQRCRAMEERLQSLLRAQLRPYQVQGVRWLTLMSDLGFGGCLADDMGLGKTIQMIALLINEVSVRPGQHLLVVPTSLLGNWEEEISRFAPLLTYKTVHRSRFSKAQMMCSSSIAESQVVITTYTTLGNTSWLKEHSWNLVILDEAQAIKNANSQQSQTVHQLISRCRFVMTGTPIENRLSDLWSLCHFFSPELLGSKKSFQTLQEQMKAKKNYAPLKKLLQPYLLRRKKTDPEIAANLPQKTEMKTYCQLSVSQMKAYQKVILELKQELIVGEGQSRQGAVLKSLMALKQICNHPSQYLQDGLYDVHQSGKFERLSYLARDIHECGEKVLVFTQFKEITDILENFLASIFGHSGLVLHGGVSASKRQEMVKIFQQVSGPSFFILTVKAGGTGLNLTEASHVIHFDRWWNPAVEQQATDRAFRIGQKKSVIVHKMICKGTIENKIDALIDAKLHLTQQIIENQEEIPISQWSDQDILDFVQLDE